MDHPSPSTVLVMSAGLDIQYSLLLSQLLAHAAAARTAAAAALNIVLWLQVL
jgi:hypothetical protein